MNLIITEVIIITIITLFVSPILQAMEEVTTVTAQCQTSSEEDTSLSLPLYNSLEDYASTEDDITAFPQIPSEESTLINVSSVERIIIEEAQNLKKRIHRKENFLFVLSIISLGSIIVGGVFAIPGYYLPAFISCLFPNTIFVMYSCAANNERRKITNGILGIQRNIQIFEQIEKMRRERDSWHSQSDPSSNEYSFIRDATLLSELGFGLKRKPRDLSANNTDSESESESEPASPVESSKTNLDQKDELGKSDTLYCSQDLLMNGKEEIEN